MTDIIQKRLQENQFSLIAEIGVNYYDIASKLNISALEAAKLMVLEAKNAGIHAVKFQTYKAETLAAKNSPSYWDINEEPTRSQYELFKKFDSFGEKEYRLLKNFCDRIGVEFCSTPFDFESVDYLNELMNFYKISSSDLTNLPFIEYIAKKGKPIVLSVGASNRDEIRTAVETIRKHNDHKITLLHCVLEYPTPYEHANLNKITALQQTYPDAYIGYSDHTKPNNYYDVIKTAYLLGAQIVEKHFTLDKTLVGNDHYHAMDGSDAKNILEQIAQIDVLRGAGALVALESERAARENARRSIVTVCAIKKGTVLTREMITFKRPGTGISPQKIDAVIGKIISKNLEADTILTPEMIEM